MVDGKKLQLLILEKTHALSFSQSPALWLKTQNLDQHFNLDQPYAQLKLDVMKIIHGVAHCKFCGMEVKRTYPGIKRGFAKTCSENCRQKLASKRQLGKSNTIHKLSKTQIKAMGEKVSQSLKNKILSGEYTPKSENYKTFKMIHYYHSDGTIRSVRSLWEQIYWIQNPTLEYETIRVPYFDSKMNRNRIYIVDFYDRNTHTLYEIKPKKYHYQLEDKIKGIQKTTFKYQIVDDDYFHKCKTPELIETINTHTINITEVESRLKWLTKP